MLSLLMLLINEVIRVVCRANVDLFLLIAELIDISLVATDGLSLRNRVLQLHYVLI